MDTVPSTTSRWRVVAVCFGLAVAGLLLGGVLILASGLLLIGMLGLELTPLVQLSISLVALQGIAFPVVGFAYLRYTGRSPRSFIPVSVPSLRTLGLVVGGLLGTFVLIMIVTVVLMSLVATEPAANTAGQTAQENPEIIPFLIPLVFLLNAPGEELLFRGVIQGRLRERFTAWPAILLTTGAFAPLHLLALVGSPVAAAMTITIISIPSIVFGYAYERTENLIVPILMHALFNSTLFLVVFVSSQ